MSQKTTLLFLTILFCLSPFSKVLAQDIYDFEGLRSSGELSDDFIMTSTDKYIAQADSMLDGRRSKESKITDDFLLKSNFILDEMLLSGSVLVNDQVGAYVNEVLDLVLIDQPELRKQISVYITKAPEVNAFATDRGVVLVNLGLFNKIENEAQLAAILAHEVTHFDERHNLSSRLKAHEIVTSKGNQKVRTIDGFLLRKHAYDRSLEYEADLKGAERMMSTNYQLQALLDVFDVLEDSRNPYKYILKETDLLNFDGMEITSVINPELALIDSLMKDQEQRFAELEDDDRDLYSTHPAVEKRQIAIKDAIGDRSLNTGELFLVGEEQFLLCQQMARLEMGRMLNNNGSFSEGLYHALLLSEDLPNHPYIEQGMMSSLFGYTMERLNRSTGGGATVSISITEEKGPADDNSYTLNWETVPVSQFKKALLKLHTIDLVSMTYSLANTLENAHPEDALYSRVKELLIRQLIKKFKLKIDGGVARFQEPSKWKDKASHDYFTALIKNEAFQSVYAISQKQEEIQNNCVPSKAQWFFNRNSVNGFKTSVFEEQGANNVLLLSPVYRTSKSLPSGNKYLPISSELKQMEMVATIREMAQNSELHLEVLDLKSTLDKSAERLNENMLLSEWMNRQTSSYDFPITADYQEVLNILQKRNISNVGQLSIVYYEEPKMAIKDRLAALGVGLILPLPLNLYYLKIAFDKYRFLVTYQTLVNVDLGIITWTELNVQMGSKDHMPLILQQTENYINELQK